MSFEDNIFNSPAEIGGPTWANEIDYGTGSVMDSGSDEWTKLFQDSLGKGLDYFSQKDAFQTRASLPQSYPPSYVRGADGKLYQSNGQPMPAQYGQPAAGNNVLLIALAVAGLILLKRG